MDNQIASFGLVDLSGGLFDSGVFHFDFQVSRVSEPSIVLLLLVGLIGIAISRQRGFSVLFDKRVMI